MKLPKITITDEVKIITLVCLILEKLGGLTEAQLLEIVTVDETIAQFGLIDALTVMEKKKLANVTGDLFEITDAGRGWLKEFAKTPAVTLRNKMLREGERVVRFAKLKKAVKWDITREKSGWAFYVCFLNEMDGSAVMEIKIHSNTNKGAAEIQEKFLKDPPKIIRNTLSNFL
ncbi:MAG: DUF4364 family protein [Oscillospiraceae bacterium]|jgi:hypothetical protein|nr:DUF4364 family protein [Oscillospiraceae bacterium]